MDFIVILLFIVVVIVWRRDFKCCVYTFGAIEIFFRLMHFIKDTLQIKELTRLINTYIPGSILDVFEKYSAGLLFNIFKIVYIGFIGLLVFYLVRYIIKRK